ncbi:histidine kinase [Anaeromyxobacter dehalogenans 2CP-1]|uniref:histidine kinase n=1 Tax=Anaeromyxobacter dehalogenans (strain ATCC BAA-258 / DSM 21875 / 2CP-1) TaxID=455488 RepID=B8JG67_ANAD2|nr:hybrid sensor histidine kinase/response regulator [Anaeromyxobacter dehalogenans]ACL66470.1 histidine kinase [Anaeromyxobacter dehalogenans 2CP-1]
MSDLHRSERVLVLAPTGRDAEVASNVLRTAGLSVMVCRDVPGALEGLREGAAVLLIAQEALGDGARDGLGEWIAHQPPWSDMPVFVVTGAAPRLDHAHALRRLSWLGNVLLLDRPLRRATLVSVVRSAIRARQRQYAAREVLAAREREVAARDQFLAMLGHELRNPLGAIVLALDVIDRRGAAEPRQLDVVRRQSRQLSRLVDDLLDVSRVTSGKIALHNRPVDLAGLVIRAVEAMQPSAAAAGVSLRAEVAPGEVPLVGDPVRLEQVVANLVGNALKYNRPGGHVVVALEASGDEAVLRVRDDGIGLAEHDLERVFDTFVQVDTGLDRARGGLGLGLTLVKTLVAMHGGQVRADSAGPGKGSTFTIRLPLAASAERAAGADRDGAGSGARSRRVLVIDDSPDNREVAQSALEMLGHVVSVAGDGPSGIEQAIRGDPEVVVIDIGLPGLDGYEVARRLRAARGRGMTLIALTGYGQPDDRQRALEAGFDVHLTKPVEIEALRRAVERPPPDA